MGIFLGKHRGRVGRELYITRLGFLQGEYNRDEGDAMM